MNRIKWTSFYGERPKEGQLCRWVVQDMLLGLWEFEARADAAGYPEGEWTEQSVLAFRVIAER